MDMNRRSFLGGIFAVAGATVVPVALAKALPVPRPILWGDGIHDDTRALNALFAGEEVECQGMAIAEDLAVKQATFAALDTICKPGAILATTTSSLPVIQCATATSRPQDVIGMHFFSPANVMKLLEVVRGEVDLGDD